MNVRAWKRIALMCRLNDARTDGQPLLFRTFLVAVAMFAWSACGGGDGPSAPQGVKVVTITLPNFPISVGGTYTLTVEAKDANGNPLTRTVAWSSSNALIASITQGGVLTPVAPGNVTISAVADGITGTAQVTVLPRPVNVVQITQSIPLMVQGQTQTFVAVTRDANNQLQTGRVITWSSSNQQVLSIQNDGSAVALAPGTTEVTALSEGKSAKVTVNVVGAPQITSTFAQGTTAGQQLTINGDNFANDVFGNVVTFGTVPAQLISATATQLVVTVPCIPGTSAVRVTRNGISSAPANITVAVERLTPAVGETSVLSTTSSQCIELGPTNGSAKYLLAVVNTSTNLALTAGIRLSGNLPAPGVVQARIPINAARLTGNMRALSPAEARLAEFEVTHRKHMQMQEAEYRQLRAASRFAPAPGRVQARVMAPELGQQRTFYFTFQTSCNNTSAPISAKAIVVGDKAVIWEDAANGLQSSSNSELLAYYNRLAQIYDQDQHESLKENFGDPLLRDAATDNDGKIHMVFTQRLNGSVAAAYVTPCDQFASSIPGAAGSNFGQVFYGFVPTIGGANVGSTSYPDGWFNFMARTVVHEVKHIVAVSSRFVNGSPTAFDETWLEEGAARMAEEMWIRRYLHRVNWKGNTGWGTASDNGVFCDFHPSNATCNAADQLRRPSFGMRRQIEEILPQLLQPWDYSAYGNVDGQNSGTFYNSTWSLLRYVMDRYAGTEAEFLSALTNTTTSGIGNLVSLANASAEELVVGWRLALFTDDYPGIPTSDARTQFQTWNLRSIYKGMKDANWQSAYGSYPGDFPIQPAPATFGSFESDAITIRGGANAYFELSGTHSTPQLLRLRSSAGGPPSSTMRLAIVRLQ